MYKPKNPTNSRIHRIAINFLYNDENDNTIYDILTPPNVYEDDLKQKILEMHEELEAISKSHKSPNPYPDEGRNADTLLWYTTQRYHWECVQLKADTIITIA